MKNLAVLLSLFFVSSFSSTSIAGVGGLTGGSTNGRLTEADSWNHIRERVRKDWRLTFSGDTAFVGQSVSVFDVCLDGDTILTKKKYPILESRYVGKARDHDNDNDGYTMVPTGKSEYLSYPLTVKRYREECNNKGKNCRKIPYSYTQETLKNIEVKKFWKTVGKEGERDLFKDLFNKDYQIPNCKFK